MLANFQVSLLTTGFDQEEGGNSDTIVLANLQVYLEDVNNAPMSRTISATLMENVNPSHIMYLARNPYVSVDTLALDKSMIVRITHERHPRLRQFFPIANGQEFSVKYVSDTNLGGDKIAVLLGRVTRSTNSA